MLEAHPNLTPTVIFGLGWVYLLLFAMNAWWTARSVHKDGNIRLPEALGSQEVPVASLWAAYSALLLMASIAHLTGYDKPDEFLIRMPEDVKYAINVLANPVTYFVLSVLAFVAVIRLREWFARPTVGWILLNIGLVFVALSMTDWDFRQIVGKPDNVPIISMVFIIGFFTWIYFRRAVENDRRIEQGRPLYENEDNDQVLVWPDLVYTEMLCMIVLSAVLIVWGICLQAPLEEPASASKTPNPSKAPWYFLGLQEMLVYFDPWLAGVVFPSVIILGLMAIPYIDINQRGNGYYTFRERKLAVSLFLFGFLPMWIAMIMLGTFLRGPNWNFFGPYEYWDVHALELLTNVDLSEYFWIYWLGMGLPEASADAPTWRRIGTILLRESPGIVVVLAYFLVLPPLLAGTLFRRLFLRMGFIRYLIFSVLLLMMAALPIKMVLRWAFNLKYIVHIHEWFFNI